MNQHDRIDLARRNMGMLLAFMLTAGVMLNGSAFANEPPTLMEFRAAVDTANVNTEVELTYTELAAQGDQADTEPGTVVAFVVQAVSSGTLKIGTSADTATSFVMVDNDTIGGPSGLRAYWTPDVGNDFGASQSAFTVKAKDDLDALSETAVEVPVDVNTPPTLSGFLAAVGVAAKNTEVELTFDALAAQGDESDGDYGSVVAFVVQEVSSDTTLKIGTSADTATSFVVGENAMIGGLSNLKAYWTPATGVTGPDITAFTVKAKDNQGGLSATAVAVLVNVTVPPTLTAFAAPVGTTAKNIEVKVTFAKLLANSDAVDTDGNVVAFVVQAVSSGTALKIGAIADTATPFEAGVNDTINARNNAYWTPATDDTGVGLTAFTVKAKDDFGALSTTAAVAVPVNVTAPSTATLVQDVAAEASSLWSPESTGVTAANIVNNSGMSDLTTPPVHTIAYSCDPAKPTHGVGSNDKQWISDDTQNLVGQWVIFTFPSARDISEFIVWNVSSEANIGVQNLTILTSVSDSAEFIQRGETWTFEMVPGDPGNYYAPYSSAVEGQGFTLSGLGGNWTGVKRVKFVISSNYGNPNSAGLSEVRFYGAAATSKKGMLLCFQ